jgi:hypothetical protein
MITIAGCSASDPGVSAGSAQDLTSGPAAAAFAAQGNFVSDDDLGRMRLDASGGDILVTVPVAGSDPNSAVIKGTLKTVNGKTTLTDARQSDCSVTLVGNQDSVQVTDETPGCTVLDGDGLLLRKYTHAKADSLKGDYTRESDASDPSAGQEAATLSVTASGDSGFAYSISIGGKPSLTDKAASMVDSADLVWSDGKTGGCTLGFILLSSKRIAVQSEQNCLDDQGVPHNYFGVYTRM